jgi:hypothetical protein
MVKIMYADRRTVQTEAYRLVIGWWCAVCELMYSWCIGPRHAEGVRCGVDDRRRTSLTIPDAPAVNRTAAEVPLSSRDH